MSTTINTIPLSNKTREHDDITNTFLSQAHTRANNRC